MDPQRLCRIFDVLEYLAVHPEGRILKQISNDLGLPVSSTHDLLQAMVRSEIALTGVRRRYALGPRAVGLGFLASHFSNVSRISSQHIKWLAAEVSEDVYLAAQTDHQVVYLERFDSSSPVNVSIKLNEPRPLHASSVGKLFSSFNSELRNKVLGSESLEKFTKNTVVDHSRLAAEFENIRQSGISVTNGESVEGVAGLSVPIYSPQGRVVAAVHISALSAMMSVERVNHIVPLLKKVSDLITKELGGARPPTRGGEQEGLPSPAPDSPTSQEA